MSNASLWTFEKDCCPTLMVTETVALKLRICMVGYLYTDRIIEIIKIPHSKVSVNYQT